MRLLPTALAAAGVLVSATPAFADPLPDFSEDSATADHPPAKAPAPWRERKLEGGVTFGFATETWSRSMFGYGPRFDVGVGVGRSFAVVVGESARFAFSSDALRMMSFDLQAGLAYGAPYQKRTGFGAVALVGADRLSTSTTVEALVEWGVTGTVGLRGSFSVGPLDLWAGLDGAVRSNSMRTGRPDPSGVGTFTTILSLGCFFPALSGQVLTASR
jgi:hypothetical protein